MSDTLADTRPLSVNEARKITDAIRGQVDRVWRLLVDAHDGQAWVALGYSSWDAYVRAEFGMSRGRSYQLLDQGRVIAAIGDASGDVSTTVDISERDARDLKDQLPAATAAIRARVEAGESPKKATTEVVRTMRAERTEQRKQRQVENDKARDATRAALPPAVKRIEEAKARNGARNAAVVREDLDAVIAERDELREENAALKADIAAVRAENKQYGDMKVLYAQGGFDAVVKAKDEEIRVLKRRVEQESADKVSWMRLAKARGRELKKLGASGDILIDIVTGEITRG
jgi:hypothetical protein